MSFNDEVLKGAVEMLDGYRKMSGNKPYCMVIGPSYEFVFRNLAKDLPVKRVNIAGVQFEYVHKKAYVGYVLGTHVLCIRDIAGTMISICEDSPASRRLLDALA